MDQYVYTMVNGKPERFGRADGLKACGAVCLTTPDSNGAIRCNLIEGHEWKEHVRAWGRFNWRSWPLNQTEPIPLQ